MKDMRHSIMRAVYASGREDVMPASIYRSPKGQAEVLGLYDGMLSGLGMGHDDTTVSTRYGETHVLSMGPDDAPPVLFLHGANFLNLTCLRWFLPLAQRYRIHSPDIVGQPGKSGQLRLSPDGDGHAWWVEDVLDGLGLKRVPFVGLSYGAGIALRTAGYAPERVSAMVLVSPAGIVTGPLVPMLIETVVPTIAYHLRPSPRGSCTRRGRYSPSTTSSPQGNSGPSTGTSSSTRSCRGWLPRGSLGTSANR